ncbi:MAG TPA: type II toxin-antitoxin system Phd/YefM family antitoxin [Polyangiaceae bacterium]|jgi:prevent-host-death family protein
MAFHGRHCDMYITMYTQRMPMQYSIADLRRNLSSAVDEAEGGAEVQLTRRGHPVAVLVSVGEYERLKANGAGFWVRYQEFRKRFPPGASGTRARHFRVPRDHGLGRKVDI